MRYFEHYVQKTGYSERITMLNNQVDKNMVYYRQI